jgi:hypothetical protein
LEGKRQQRLSALYDRGCAVAAHYQSYRAALTTLNIKNHLTTSTTRVALALGWVGGYGKCHNGVRGVVSLGIV